jgi:PAS domain S-box-containing protein
MQLDITHFCTTLVHDMADAVVYSNAEGQVRYWNRGTERIFGFSEPEALGQSLDIIIPGNLRQRHWAGYDETMRAGTTRYGAGDVVAVPAIRKGGSRLSVELTILPFRDGTGAMVGVAAVLREVTQRFDETKRLRKGLRELKARADDRWGDRGSGI